MTTYLKDAAQAIGSLTNRLASRLLSALRPQRRRVIEIEYRRRSDIGTRRSAAIHVDAAKGRRQRS